LTATDRLTPLEPAEVRHLRRPHCTSPSSTCHHLVIGVLPALMWRLPIRSRMRALPVVACHRGDGRPRSAVSRVARLTRREVRE
jgi:hypothetical protein